MKQKFAFVMGTAAELIKVFPVLLAASKRGHQIQVISTGQSGAGFAMQYADLGLPNDWLVPPLTVGQDLDRARRALTWFARALLLGPSRLKSALGPRAPSAAGQWVVVHGDTLSTLVGAWSGYKCGWPVVHIEAGLRSDHLLHPFPEELTRRWVSRLATVHMAPDLQAANNLKHSGVGGLIVNTNGNTLRDAISMAPSSSTARLPEPPFGLVNIHRFENLNSPKRWAAIVATLLTAAERCPLVMVTHPQTRHKLEQDLQTKRKLESGRIQLCERLPFSAFVHLLKAAEFLISDGGSNQEECSYLGKPCLLLREFTERREGLTTCCVLSRFDTAVIQDFLKEPSRFHFPAEAAAPSPTANLIDALEETST